jgi:hypothetical protein
VYAGGIVAGVTASLGLNSAALSSDASGRQLLFSANDGVLSVWVASGRVHYLGQDQIWSAAW